MIIDVENECNLNFNSVFAVTDLYDDLLLDGDLKQQIINRLEDYESTRVEFNKVEIVGFVFDKRDDSLQLDIKIHNLMSLNTSFCYKRITVR